MLRAGLVGLLMLTQIARAFAAALILCPDCEQPVSHRALMCPHCGCPGDAIAEAAAMLTEAAEPLLSPLVRVEASAGTGYGVGVLEGGTHYVVMDARLLWEAERLTIVPTTTNTPVAYWGLQLAADVPLARFSTDATNIAYLVAAPTTEAMATQPQWLVPIEDREVPFTVKATTSSGAHPVAAVDGSTNIVGVTYRTEGDRIAHAAPSGREWRDVAPAILRAQTRLLRQAEREILAGELSTETARQLADAQWVNEPMRLHAEMMRQGKGEE